MGVQFLYFGWTVHLFWWITDIKQALKWDGASLYLTLLQNEVYLGSLIRETSGDFSPYEHIFNSSSGQEQLGFLSATFADLRKIPLKLSFFIGSPEILPLTSPPGVLKNEMR